jgi:hypothetical protein
VLVNLLSNAVKFTDSRDGEAGARQQLRQAGEHRRRRHYRLVCRTLTDRMSGNRALLIDASRRTVAPSGRTMAPIPEVAD